MSTKKTIQINPELFKIPGQKTQKNRAKKELTIVPIVSTNNIKHKLLNRIKEHKKLQHKHIADINTKMPINTSIVNEPDEFSSALTYLTDLSKKQKQTAVNDRNKTLLQTKTVKNYNPTIITSPYVELELPIELQHIEQPPRFNEPLKMSYKTDNEIPYGCLKGCSKPSYRSWIQTRKNIEHPELLNLPQVRPPTPPKRQDTSLTNVQLQAHTNDDKINISREQRLLQIKSKLKKLQDNDKNNEFANSERMLQEIKQNMSNNVLDELPMLDNDSPKINARVIEGLIKEPESIINSNNLSNPRTKIKKTTKRTFTLGKSDKLRSVAVLIKNKQTRKNLINTQKDLKKTDITDVRKYLRQHGIIKIGTTCPPDILRKTFETALMAGEITNTNRDTLIHNFLHEDTATK